MKIRDLDGNEHVWNLSKYVGKINNNASQLHRQVRNFIKEKSPAAQILEEVHLPGEKLYLDFYLPLLKLAIECQGGQHDKYTPFFHGELKSKGFANAKSRDRRKREFCENNGITLLYFYPKEDEEEWTKKLREI